MEAEGLVITEIEFIGKRVRKYYKLTKSGETTVKEKVKELSEFMNTMKALLHIKPSSQFG